MRVLLHLQSTLRSLTGVGHYAAELHRCLCEQAPGEITGSMPQWMLKMYRGMGPQRNRVRWIMSLPLRAKMMAYQWMALRMGPFDLYHEPNFIPSPCKLPTIANIHDLSVPLYPQWHPEKRVQWFEQGMKRMLDQCVHFFTISDAVRREVINTVGLSPTRVTRIYLGVRPALRPLPQDEVALRLQELGLPPRYLLYVGTIEPRKNILTLLGAYCDLPSSLRQAYPLVLAGSWGWRTEEVAAFYEAEGKHKGVIRLGYVAEKDLGILYNGARALVYPSFYEGLGLPPLEMLACGGAVLASTADAIAEVVGGQAHLIDPQDVVGWRDGLQRVLMDEDWWKQLRGGSVEHARPFTWERCAEETIKVYRHIAAGRYDCGPPLKTAQVA